MTMEECRDAAKALVDQVMMHRANWRILANLEKKSGLSIRTLTNLWLDLNKPDLRIKQNYEKLVKSIEIAKEIKNANDK